MSGVWKGASSGLLSRTPGIRRLRCTRGVEKEPCCAFWKDEGTEQIHQISVVSLLNVSVPTLLGSGLSREGVGMGYTLSGPLKLETTRAGIESECVYAPVVCVEQR